VPVLPGPGALLFDLDGTLVDTVGTRIRAWMEALGQVALPTARDQIADLIGLDGRQLAREVAAAAGRDLSDAEAEALDREAGEIYGRLNSDPTPLPGLKPLLRALERQRIPWAIATSSRREQVAASVAALGFATPPRIVDGTHVTMAKPDPELLLLGARDLGVRPEVCWYVGDSTWDMRAAVAAGMVGVAVTAGSAVDHTALAGAGATVSVGTLDEIAQLVRDGIAS